MSSVPSFSASLVALASFAPTSRDAYGHALKALDEVAVMLAGQQGRRADDRDLLARQGRDEGRAQGYLGLAEADIAADQPVHRLTRRQVLDHV